MIRLSICVPAFNAADYIGMCARSLFSQTMAPDCEFIFLDDGSTDGTLERLRQTRLEFPNIPDERVRILAGRDNGGIGAARQRLLKEARGRYLAFCDADDWVDPDGYSRLVSRLESTGADFACCGLAVQDAHGDESQIMPQAYETAHEFVAAEMPSRIFNSPCNKVYRRSFLDQAGELEAPRLKVGSDLLFNAWHMRRSGRAVFCPMAFYHYRYNPKSVSHARDLASGRAIIDLAGRVADLYPDEVFAAARDRLLRNALLAAIRYAALKPQAYRALRSRIRGPLLRDARYGVAKRLMLLLAEFSYGLACWLSRIFLQVKSRGVVQ